MPITKVQLTGGQFQDSEGSVLALGYLVMKLNQDSVVNTSQICSGIEIKILLDTNGSVVASPAQSVWGNDQLSPANSYYRVTGYKANGQPAWGPNNQQAIGNGGTFDVGTWIPNSVISWTPPVQVPVLQTNEVANGNQTILDLHAGANVTLTDNGLGRVTIASTGVPPIPASATGPFFIGPGFMTTQLPSTSSSGINAGWANGIRISRFILTTPMVIARASFLAQSNANGNCSFGIYSSDGLTKILDSGVFSSTGFPNPTIFTSTFTPVTIPSGVYWMAQTDSSISGGWAIQSFNANTLSSLLDGGSAPVTGTRNFRGISTSVSSGGALPSTVSLTFDHTDDNTCAAIIWESQ